MKTRFAMPLLFLFACLSGCSQSRPGKVQAIGGLCEDCELLFEGMPREMSKHAAISSPGEPGDRLIITGTVFQKDGTTPAAGVVLYVYQTDNTGHYTPSATQVHGRQHGHLRGWMKTDAQGNYEFQTILPAAYPDNSNPRHIHAIIYEPDKGCYYWIDDYLFDDDPLLSEEKKRKAKSGRGGCGVLILTKDSKGNFTGLRNIVLGLNIPNYPRP